MRLFHDSHIFVCYSRTFIYTDKSLVDRDLSALTKVDFVVSFFLSLSLSLVCSLLFAHFFLFLAQSGTKCNSGLFEWFREITFTMAIWYLWCKLIDNQSILINQAMNWFEFAGVSRNRE